ncbi:MAG: DNA-3-methyladenine glycosylase I [Chitinivibrionales bacterium]
MLAVKRCPWAGNDPDYIAYHDNEWGVAVHDDVKLFEMLVLEGFQAGLSWLTILKKRPAFRAAFCQWDLARVARFTKKDLWRLMANESIVRNALKIESAVGNARRVIAVAEEFGSFDSFIWKFTEGKTLAPSKAYSSWKSVPCKTPISDAMSKDLKKRGFSFVGSVICYSFMQTIGMVDDHVRGCFKCNVRL